MYRVQPQRLAPDQVAHLVTISAPLRVDLGSGGSHMSNYAQTIDLFQSLLGPMFPGKWTRSSVVSLYPSQQIVAHRDPAIEGIRHHIPLDLNEGCWVYHAGDWQQLEVGRVYQMDPTELHGAVNWGSTTRLHLIIDQR